MTKSELIDLLANDQEHLPKQDVEAAVKALVQRMSDALAGGERIEIRGFGSFSLHYRPPRLGRNPKTRKVTDTSLAWRVWRCAWDSGFWRLSSREMIRRRIRFSASVS
jgi:integration host factor beta subunit